MAPNPPSQANPAAHSPPVLLPTQALRCRAPVGASAGVRVPICSKTVSCTGREACVSRTPRRLTLKAGGSLSALCCGARGAGAGTGACPEQVWEAAGRGGWQ